jgi:hypothetical protein
MVNRISLFCVKLLMPALLLSCAAGALALADLQTSFTINTPPLSATGNGKYTPGPMPPQTSFTIDTPKLAATGTEKYTPPPAPPQTNFVINTPPLSAGGTQR